MICTIFSILGSIYIIKFCSKASSQENTAVKFILAMALADLVFSATNILSAFQPAVVGPCQTSLCTTEAVIRQISYMYTILFSACSAILASKAATPMRSFNPHLLFRSSIIIGGLIGLILCLGYPFLFSPILTFKNSPVVFSDYIIFSNGPLYCWIGYSPSATTSQKLTVILIYQALPILLGSIITIHSYRYVMKVFKALPDTLLSKMDFKASTLWWYPAALFVSLIPCVIYTTLELYRPPAVWAKFIHLVLPHSIGFTNAIVYGVQHKLYYSEEDDDDDEYRHQGLKGYPTDISLIGIL